MQENGKNDKFTLNLPFPNEMLGTGKLEWLERWDGSAQGLRDGEQPIQEEIVSTSHENYLERHLNPERFP